MNKPDFKKEFFINNRQRLRQRLEGDHLIAVTASGLVQRGADSPYPFVQDANFWYLTGINDPDIILVMDGPREFLMVSIREGNRVTFDGQIDQSHLTALSGIGDIINEASGWKRLDGLLEKSRQLATLAPAPVYIEVYGMYANPARAHFMDRIKQHVPDLEMIDIRQELARLRMIKQPEELLSLQAAIDITASSITESFAKGNYDYEYQLEAEISRGFRSRGADGQAFESIVAGGRRACTLHNIDNSSAINPKELVVVDVGAAVNGYAADITRMYCRSKANKRQRAVFAAVKEAQDYAFSLLGPNVKLGSYEKKVVRFMGQQLKSLGLSVTNDDQSIRRYFPHATSHFLGLNVHDVGDYNQPLKAGIVMTVEPGIYIPEENIGVRLEDDVLITADGIQVLSAALPAKL